MSRKNKESAVKPRLTNEAMEILIIKGVVLFFMAVLIYIPAMNGGYIYDDDSLLYQNPAMRRGDASWNADAWSGLKALWFPVGADANVAADYAPLSNTTLWLEFRLWGNNGDMNGPEQNPKDRGIGAPGYHTTNVLLHGIASLLLWYLLAQMSIPGAWLAALVWAVHPVCAESVAWIAERRNPLSMILFMLTMINWFKFRRTGRQTTYWLAVFLFVLTMFAKTSIVMLPALLLLCAWWENGWTVQPKSRQVLLALAAEALAILWCGGGLFSWRVGQIFGFIVFAIIATPVLGYCFKLLYDRLEPFWRNVIDFQAALFVFLVWCGSFILLLMCLNGYGPFDLSLTVGLVGFAVVCTAPAFYILKLLNDRLGPVWRQVLPFFYTSIIFGIITIYFQNFRAINKELVPGYITNPLERIPAACFALGFYFYKIICPLNLNLIYQQWHRTIQHAGATPEDVLKALNFQALNGGKPVPWSILGLAKELIIGVDFAAFFYWAWRNRATWGRHAILGIGSFVIMILPVLGFTRMAYMRLTLVSDHFQYAPMVGVIVVIVAGLTVVYKQLQPAIQPVLITVGAGLVVAFSVLTVERAYAISDPARLWVDNVTKNPDSWQGHSHLGAIYWSSLKNHDVPDALKEWKLSVDFAPYLYETHNNYALALNESGYPQESLDQFKIAVGIDPEQFKVRTNYANALLNAGQREQAKKNFDKAQDYYQQAIQQYIEVLKFDGEPAVLNALGVAYLQTDQLDAAINCFGQAENIFERMTRQKNSDYIRNFQQAHLLKQRELEMPSASPAPNSGVKAPATNPAPSTSGSH